MIPKHIQMVRYIISGGAAVVLNFAVLYSLTEFLHIGVRPGFMLRHDLAGDLLGQLRVRRLEALGQL